MNSSQKQGILDRIEEFERLDIVTLYTEKYKGKSSLDAIPVGDYSVAEIVTLAQSTISKLKAYLNAKDWRILPHTQQLADLGQMPNNGLTGVVANLISSLKSFQNAQAIKWIKMLEYYETINNIWYIGDEREDRKEQEEELANTILRTKTTETLQKKRQEEVDNLIEQLKKEKEALEKVKVEKRGEFDLLKKNQAESQSILDDIKACLVSTNDTKSQVQKTNNDIQEIFDKLHQTQAEIKRAQEEAQRLNDQAHAENERVEKEINAEAERAKVIYDEVVEQKSKIDQMMGFIADGTLAHSFNHRKQDIDKKMRSWFWGSIVSGILFILWVICLFSCPIFQFNSENEWIRLLVGALKASPLAYFFVYSIRRYSSERLLNEEYAFREVIAVTLNGYLSRLNVEKDPNTIELFKQAIAKLYVKPRSSKDDGAIVKEEIKELMGLIQQVNATIGSIKQ